MMRFIAKIVLTPNTMYGEEIVKIHTFTDPKKLEDFLRSRAETQLIGVELIEEEVKL